MSLNILMVTEYNTYIQCFLVTAVDTIQHLNWEQVKELPPLLSKRLSGLATVVLEMEDKRLVMNMDVEKVLADTGGFYEERKFDNIPKLDTDKQYTILFANDSAVARKQITPTLNHLGVRYIMNINGAKAWEQPEAMATHCEESGKGFRDEIKLLLADVQMPEMGGFVLTQKIKADPRLKHLPVVMHSSLTALGN